MLKGSKLLLPFSCQALGLHDMAVAHHKAHLSIARQQKDQAAEACALCNLGNCFAARGDFVHALPFYEQFLMISQVCTRSNVMRGVWV